MDRGLWSFGVGRCVRTVLLVFPFVALAPVAALHAQSDLPSALEDAGAGEPKPRMNDREAEAGELEAVAADTDPTKPVFFSFRNEFYDLKQGLWRNDTLLRADRAIFEKTRLPGRARGLLLRADLPAVVTFHDGDDTQTGLGDLYGQALLAPRISGPLFLAVGTGLVLPTATGEGLGLGKWIVLGEGRTDELQGWVPSRCDALAARRNFAQGGNSLRRTPAGRLDPQVGLLYDKVLMTPV